MAKSHLSVEQFTMFVFFGFLLLLCLVSLLLSANRNTSHFFSQRQYVTQQLDDINNIRHDIQTYYQTYNQLPTSLDQLETKSYFFDPQTGGKYIYYSTSSTDYSLCYYHTTQEPHDDSLFDIVFPPLHVFDRGETSQQCTSYNVTQSMTGI